MSDPVFEGDDTLVAASRERLAKSSFVTAADQVPLDRLEQQLQLLKQQLADGLVGPEERLRDLLAARNAEIAAIERTHGDLYAR